MLFCLHKTVKLLKGYAESVYPKYIQIILTVLPSFAFLLFCISFAEECFGMFRKRKTSR